MLDWKDDIADAIDTTQTDDVENYVRRIFTDAEINLFNSTIDGVPTFDIAKFWSSVQIQAEFPLLSRVALGTLSIPASSASSERVFSNAGRVVEKRRTRLSDKSVDALLFLHSKHVTEEQ